MGRRAVLCPRCRQIIGSDETVCSWCGASRTNPWWQAVAMVRGSGGSGWFGMAILSLNILFYLLSLLLSAKLDTPGSLHLSPGQNSLFMLGATGTVPIDRFGRLWSIVSASYLHGGLLHLLFNLMALRQLVAWVGAEYGNSRMFVIYTVGGIAGYGVSYLAGVPFTVGASASLCSLIGSLLYFGKSRGGVYGSTVYREVGGWAVGLFLFGLLVPGINNWAHGGGILGGILLGALLGYSEQRAEGALHHGLSFVCWVVTLGVLVWALFGARV